MNVANIIKQREVISRKLAFALSTMDKKDAIKELRKQLIDLQEQCPHFDSNFNWAIVDDECPYCGKVILFGGNDDD